MDSRNVTEEFHIEGDRLGAIFKRQMELFEKYREIEGMPPSFDVNTAETQKWIKDFLWRATEELMEGRYELSVMKDDPALFFEEVADAFHFIIESFIIAGFGYDQFRVQGDVKIIVPLVDEVDHKLLNRSDNLSAYALFDDESAVSSLRGKPYRYKKRCMHLGSITSIENLVMTVKSSEFCDLYSDMAAAVIYRLGLVGMCCRNKPWKQSQVTIDSRVLFHNMREVLRFFVMGCLRIGIDLDMLTQMYFKKSVINKFRQESGY